MAKPGHELADLGDKYQALDFGQMMARPEDNDRALRDIERNDHANVARKPTSHERRAARLDTRLRAIRLGGSRASGSYRENPNSLVDLLTVTAHEGIGNRAKAGNMSRGCIVHRRRDAAEIRL